MSVRVIYAAWSKLVHAAESRHATGVRPPWVRVRVTVRVRVRVRVGVRVTVRVREG